MADDPLIHDLECAEDPTRKQPKVIYAGDTYQQQPYAIVTQDDIALVGDKNNVLSVNPKFGIGLSGRVSLSCLPDQLSFAGGYWRLDPRHLSTLPSTTPTPIPLLQKAKPWLLKARDEIKKVVEGMEKA